MDVWPKVLIGVPIFDGMRYCLDEFFRGIGSLTYPNADVLVVDNSFGDEFFDELKKEIGFIVLRDETSARKPAERLVSSRNLILGYALQNGYDYVFALDADVVCPRDIIERLLECKKDIVSGLYFNYFNSKPGLKVLSVAWKGILPEEFEIIRSQIKLPANVLSHNDLQRHLTQKEIDSDELVDVIYPSAGCMLVSKEVFSKARYGIPRAPEGFTAVGDDIYFLQEAKKFGFGAWCHTALKCDHLLAGKFVKDENGNLIHPLNPDYYRKG